MRAMIIATLIVCSAPAMAQDTQPATPAPDMEVVPALKGEPAPKDGLLVPEQRFIQLLQAEHKVEELTRKLEVEQKATDSAIDACEKLVERVEREPAWFEAPILWATAGAIIGGGVVAVAVWSGTEVAKANK